MNRKLVSLNTLLVMAVLILAACRSTAAPDPSADEPVDDTAATTDETVAEEGEESVTEEAGAEEAPSDDADAADNEGDEDLFRIGVSWDTWTLDPAGAYGSWIGDFMLRTTYDTLVQMRGFPYEPQMLLARDYEVNDTFTEWTFYLRDDAVFHDGTPVEASDVKYSWDRIFATGSDATSLWPDIADADTAVVVDEHTIRFDLSVPYADFLATLPWFYIVNADLVRENAAEGDFGDEGDYGQAWLAENEAGSGPFALESFAPNEQHSFVAVEDYWYGWPNEDHMDRIIVKIMPASSTQKLALQGGELEWAGDLSDEDFLALEAEEGIATNMRGDSYFFLHMNNQEGPLSDPNVRKAVAHAFNYDALLEAVLGRKAEGVLASNVPGYIPVDMPEYDLEKAQEYLSQSEYPEGGFEITFLQLADYKPDELAGLLLKEGLANLNITVNLQPTEWTQYSEICRNPESAAGHMLSIEIPTGYSVPFMLDERYNSDNWGSVTGCSFYQNEEVDQLLQELKSGFDEEKVARIQELVAEDTPQLLLYLYGYKEAYTDRLQGLGEQYPYPYPPFPQDLYFAD